MYEHECICNERSIPMGVNEPAEKQICTRANDLLNLLREIECMANRIDGTLFSPKMETEKKCDPTPCCLAENIDMALDEARVIAKSLDKIIQRL